MAKRIEAMIKFAVCMVAFLVIPCTGCVAVLRERPELKGDTIHITETGLFPAPYALAVCGVKDVRLRLDFQVAMK